jgi:chromosome partitioning protein
MQVISFVSLKGGVGKSSSAISVAKILSEKSRVLLIDLDPQNATSSHFCPDFEGKTIREVLKNEVDIADVIQKIKKNLDFVPSNIELSIIEIELAREGNNTMRLFEALDSIDDEYDYCVIDTPPTPGLLMNSAVIASDLVVIPTQAEKFSANAVGLTLTILESNKKMSRYTNKSFKTVILPTFFEGNRTVKTVMLDKVFEAFGEIVSRDLIHLSTDVAKTYAQIGEFLPKSSRPHKEYKAFVEKFIWEAEHV